MINHTNLVILNFDKVFAETFESRAYSKDDRSLTEKKKIVFSCEICLVTLEAIFYVKLISGEAGII